MTKHIVITGPNTLEAMCDMAVERGYTHVWVHPSSGIEILEPNGKLSDEWDNPIFNYQFDPGAHDNHLVSVYGRKNLGGHKKSHSVHITFLAYSPWEWQDRTPEQILELVQLLEGKLGVDAGAPSTMGMKYVQKVVTKYHPKWIARPDTNLSLFNFKAPLVWSRPPTQEELGRKYAYYLDRNSSYPRIGVAEKFGVGVPTHYGAREFDAKLPGMWRIDVVHSPDLDERLPHPLYRIEGREWLPTAIVKLLTSKNVGCEIEVKEAIVFPKCEFVFKDSINNLWGFRNEYAKGTPERSAFKNVMNALVGTTNGDFNNWKNRPDWYTHFVSCSRAVVYYNIFKIAKEDSMYPVLCLTDALLYLSNEERPELAVPNMRIADGLGCYKLEFRVEMTDKAREILTTDKITSTGMRKHYLEALRGE